MKKTENKQTEVISGSVAQAADRYAIDALGISSLKLMRRASQAVADHVVRQVLPKTGLRPVLVLAGMGNNGADGLCIARLLQAAGISVQVVLCGNLLSASWECLHQLSECRKNKVPLAAYRPSGSGAYGSGSDCQWPDGAILIDALFGVGLNRAVRGQYEVCIREMARQRFVYRIAVDIPSGIHADSGAVMGIALPADETVTIGRLKSGLLTGSGPQYAGKLTVRRIGIPAVAYQKALASLSKTV